MDIKQLIKLLKMYPTDTEVYAYDEEVSTIVPVQDVVYSSKDNIIELTTNDSA